MKALLKSILAKCGYKLVLNDPTKVLLDRGETSHGRRVQLIHEAGVQVVLDVGAHMGWYAADLRTFGFTGKIISFEPQTVPYQELRDRASRDVGWSAENFALGDADTTTTLHLSESRESSSILDILPKHVEALPGSRVLGSEEIQVFRLDSILSRYADPQDKVFLKLDVQGFEKKVLEGAGGCMGQICGIQLEMSLKPLYEGESLFSELYSEMESEGFHLAWVEPGFRDEKTGELLQLDGIFIRPTNRK